MEATLKELLPEVPDPGNKNVSAKLDFLTKLLCAVAKMVQDVQHSCQDSQEDIKSFQENISGFKSNIQDITKETADLQSQLNQAQQKYKALNEHVLRLESQSRRDNLKIAGIPESPGEESWSDCKEKVYSILETQMEIPHARDIRITRCHRLGPKRRDAKKPRSIIFKLHWFGDRELIWERKAKLRGSNYWLDEDYPVEIENRRRILQPIASAARSQGKKARVQVDRLLVNGRPYTVDTISQLPEDLQPAKLATKTDGKITAFFRSATPLSNFHQVKVKDKEGNVFHSSEQWYQYQKALEFRDTETATNIKNSSTPLECYQLGKTVRNFNMRQWSLKAKQVMLEAVSAKFEQNPYTQKHLKDTKDTIIAEANPRDKLWGIALSMNNKSLFNKEAWQGQNWMGEILMSVRDNM